MSGQKTGDNDQWGLVSTDGTAAGAGVAVLPAGYGGPPLIDPDRKVWTREGGGDLPAFGDVIRYENGGAFAPQSFAVVSAAPARVLRFYGFHTLPGVLYLQAYNLAAGPPGIGDIPFAQFPVPQNAPYCLDYGQFPKRVLVGLVLALSTTSGVYTAAAAVGWFNAETAAIPP